MDQYLQWSILGNPAPTILISLAWVVGGFIGGKLLSWISANILKVLTAKTETKLDDIILAIVEKPLVVIITTAGLAFGVDNLDLSNGVQRWVDKIFIVVVAFVTAWTLTKIFDAIVDEYIVPVVAKSEGNLDDQILPIFRKAVKLLIWVIAVIFSLKSVGYDVGALLAGLGIGGVAIALAAKDTLSNVFGSVSVFIDRPFTINDRIKVAGYDGTVIEIGLRTSRLRTLDNRIVTVPNLAFTAGPIENISSEPSTRVVNTLDLARSNSADKLAEAVAILKAVGAETEGTDGKPSAGVASIGEYSYKVSFVYFVKKGVDYAGTLNAVNLEVLRRFEKAKIALALPTRQLIN